MDDWEGRKQFFRNPTLYLDFLAEREEILRHKWYLSEQAGTDVGFERALLHWLVHHRAAWWSMRHAQTEAHQAV